MKREDEIKVLELHGYNVVEFNIEQALSLAEGRVVCPSGNEGGVKHREYDTCDRDVIGVSDDGEIQVASHFDCEGSGEFVFFTCFCDDCLKKNPKGMA